MDAVKNGTVKWFDSEKGYGFIMPKDLSADVFIHISVVKQSKLEVLEEGNAVTYEMGVGKNGKIQAIKVDLVG